MIKCAFIGLGVMGYPMAGHLDGAGYEVAVWNRTQMKAEAWAFEHKGRAAVTIRDCVDDADFIMFCVGDDKDVMDVVVPALEGVKPGALLIDHTTASSECARACYDMAKKAKAAFIDAPISGGEAGAQNGQLTIMCGGDEAAFKQAFAVMQPYAKAVTLMGGPGAGQLTKMVNQICIAGLLQALSEGVFFAQAAGLDMKQVLTAIGKGAAQSWQMDNRAVTMSEDKFDFGFAVDWMRKDLGIAIKTAKDLGIDLPVTGLVDGYYKDVQDMGGKRWDTSSLIRRLTRGADIISG